jgi:hypothetical protein
VAINSIYIGTSATTCFVIGNKFPSGGSANVVGQTPAYGVYNSNTIGINTGMSDTISIHASSGSSASDSTGTGNTFHHWVLLDTNDYWQVNSTTTSASRSLYFPIVGLPNGAKLTAVRVQGKILISNGTLDAQVWKRSVNSSGAHSISSDLVIGSPWGEFNNTTTIGKVTVSNEIVNYAESTYYIKISHVMANPPNPSDIRIYGITIEFTY